MSGQIQTCSLRFLPYKAHTHAARTRMCTHGHTRMQRTRAHAEPCACQTRPYVEILSVVISRSGIMGGSNFLHFAFPYFITLLSLPEDSDMIHTSFFFLFFRTGAFVRPHRSQGPCRLTVPYVFIFYTCSTWSSSDTYCFEGGSIFSFFKILT